MNNRGNYGGLVGSKTVRLVACYFNHIDGIWIIGIHWNFLYLTVQVSGHILCEFNSSLVRLMLFKPKLNYPSMNKSI